MAVTGTPTSFSQGRFTLPSFLAYAGAFALIGASIALNVVAAIDRGGSDVERAAWVATAIGADLVKAVAPLVLFGAGVSIFRRSAASILLMIVLAFGTVNALTYSHGKRAALSSEAAKIEAQRNALEDDRARLEKKAATAKTKDERNAAEKALAGTRTELARMPVEKQDAGAVAIVGYLAAFGYVTTPAIVATWLSALPVALLELGSCLALLVAGGIHPRARGVVVQREPVVVDVTPQPVANVVPSLPTSPQTVSAVVPVAGARLKAERAILDAVKSGEELPASVRKLAVRIGGSRGTVHNAVVALVAAGAIERVGDVIRAAG